MELLLKLLGAFVLTYQPLILVSLGVINVLVLVWLGVTTVQAVKWRRRYCLLMGKTSGQSLEEKLIEYRSRTEEVLSLLPAIQAKLTGMECLQPAFIQRVGVVRFNAFPEMGSDLSFAVALMNAQGNGVVLSSIYGREESRVFAKPIQEGKSTYRLTMEEERAIALTKGYACDQAGDRLAVDFAKPKVVTL